MLRTRPSLDWQILEEDEEWTAIVGAAPQPDCQPPLRTRRVTLLTAASLSLLLLILAGSLLYRRATQNLARIENELDNTVAAEAWTRQHSSTDLSRVRIGSPSQPAGQVEESTSDSQDQPVPVSTPPAVQHLMLYGDWAMVRVRIDASRTTWQTDPYLETRFYRQTETGWLRTAPPAEFWGKMSTAETTYFTVTYWQRDAEAVAEVLASIDEQYEALCMELGLNPNDIDRVLRIRVQPVRFPSTDPILFRFQGNELNIPSPLQVPRPEKMTDTDVLRASITEPLAVHILDQQMVKRRDPSSWQPLRDGLRLWIRQEYGALPSAYQRELSRRLENWPNVGTLQLSKLTFYDTWCPPCPSDSNYDELRKAAARALISYAIMTYGRATLPKLIEAMEKYDAWEALITAAFGVSAGEFEKGWQAYLADEYQ